MSFLSHPDVQLAINHTDLYFSLVKEKDKWGHWFGLKVLIRFKIELVYAFSFYEKNFYKKMSLKNPKTLRKC